MSYLIYKHIYRLLIFKHALDYRRLAKDGKDCGPLDVKSTQ